MHDIEESQEFADAVRKFRDQYVMGGIEMAHRDGINSAVAIYGLMEASLLLFHQATKDKHKTAEDFQVLVEGMLGDWKNSTLQ